MSDLDEIEALSKKEISAKTQRDSLKDARVSQTSKR